MATFENKGRLTYKDTNGDLHRLYPVTQKECIEGMEEIDAHLVDQNNPHNVKVEQIGAVPETRTINGKPLSADIVLTPEDSNSVPKTRTINGKSLETDVVLVPSDLDAVPETRKVNGKELSSDIELVPDDVGAVPNTRTVNGKQLNADVVLVSEDLGAVPETRTINGKPLSDDITLSFDDIGAPEMQDNVQNLQNKVALLEHMIMANDFFAPMATDDADLTILTDDSDNAILANWRYKEV